MALPIRPNNPNIPIPNTPFSAPLNAYVNGPYFPVVMGTGIDIGSDNKVANLNNAGVLEFSGATGDINLLGGTGISVIETVVGNNSDFTINNLGVLGLIAGGNVSISESDGIYTISATDAQTGTVTSVGTGVGLTGGPITTSGTISLDVSGVTSGSYTYPSITVDAYGRITLAANGTAPVTAITGTAPVQVTGTAPTLNVAIASASTSAPGAVQLNNTLSSSLTTQALTAAQGKVLQDQITALSVASNITLAGTLDASTGNLTTVTAEGTAAGFATGSPLPAAASGNDNYFVIASVAAASYTPPGGSATVVHVGDWFLSDGSIWQFLDVGDSSGGTVTSVATSAALTGGPITTSGTLDLAVTGVTAGAVNYPASVTVDACGRITALGAASNPVTEADFQAKGDLVSGYGVNAYGVVTVGSNGQVLTANTSCASGLEWTTPAADVGSATPTVEGTLFGRSDNTDCNTAVGYCALGCLTSGSLNAALGAGALGAIEDGGVNVAVGYLALSCSVSDSFNTALGYGAMECTNGGSQNVAVGNSALNSNVTGWFNTAVGDGALVFYNGGCYNVAVGRSSMSSYASGACNTAIGYQSLRGSNSTGSSNVGVGVQAGCNISSGCLNVAIGPFTQVASPTGNCQLAIGFASTCNWLTGDSTKAIKPGAGIIDCANSCGTAGQVLMSNGSNAICWGTAPSGGIPCSIITSKGNIIVGTAANTPAALPAGSYNQVLLADSGCTTGLKWGSLPQASVAGLGVVYGCTTDSASCNTSLGYYSLAYTSATCTIVLGNGSMIGSSGDSHIAIGVGIAAAQGAASCNVVIGNRIGGGNFQNSAQNVIVGQYAACGCLSESNRNVIIGAGSGTTLNLACNNVAIGYGVAPPSSSAKCTLAIGYATGCHWLTGDCNKAIKPGAGIIDCANSCGTAGQVLMSNGSNAICWGTVAGGSGTVTSIAAGTGLTGGTITTAGTIALDTTCVIQPTLLTAKGDLITATAASTPTALTVGTNGQVLSACSDCAGGLYWATPQTSPYITYTTSAVSYTSGTPLLVAIWGGGTMQGTVSLDLVGYGGFQSYWDFFLSGDPTNYNTGWNQTNYYPPTSSGVSQGTWSVDFPVYPDPNANKWMIYFNPTQNSLNASPFTFFYRLLAGGNPSWQI